MTPISFLWTSDLHLDHCTPKQFWLFIDQCNAAQREDTNCVGLIIAGDIANGRMLISCLDELNARFSGKVYYVLGNHDYYGSSLRVINASVMEHASEHPGVVFLPAEAKLWFPDSQLALVGASGWGDGRNGDGANTEVMLNDFFQIKELQQALAKAPAAQGHARLFKLLNRLGDQSAARLRAKLPGASGAANLIVVTHVPPFVESCRFLGRRSDPDFLPLYSNQAMGLMLERYLNPAQNVIVLAGHTHQQASITHHGVRVEVSQVEYGHPVLNKLELVDGKFMNTKLI